MQFLSLQPHEKFPASAHVFKVGLDLSMLYEEWPSYDFLTHYKPVRQNNQSLSIPHKPRLTNVLSL